MRTNNPFDKLVQCLNEPFEKPMFPRDSVENNRMETAFGFFATVPGCSASCGSNSCGSSVRFGTVVGRCSWQATSARLPNINRRRERFRTRRVMGAWLLLTEDHKPLLLLEQSSKLAQLFERIANDRERAAKVVRPRRTKWVQAGLDQGSRLEAIEPDVEKSFGILAHGTGRTRRLVGSEVHLGQCLIVMEGIGTGWRIV